MAVASESKASPKKEIEETKKRRRVIEDGANDDDGNKAKRAKCPGVRVVGNRIYDSENGKSCHQCRQKTLDFSASCKNMKVNKLCAINFCHKCLLNRYGEKAEEVEMLADWKCPKCRGICNCSFCMKKKGHKPTGQLVQTARSAGYSSVSEMLNVNGSEELGDEKVVENVGVSPNQPVALNKEPEVVSPKKLGKENSFDRKTDTDSNSQKLATDFDDKSKKIKREGLKEICNGSNDKGSHPKKSSSMKAKVIEFSKEEVKVTGISKNNNYNTKVQKDVPLSPIKSEEKKDGRTLKDAGALNALKIENARDKPRKVRVSNKVRKCTMGLEDTEFDADIALPQGANLATVAEIELPPADVGNALQFLEFCASFGKVLDVKKGQAASLLRELRYGRRGRRAQYSMTVHFQIQLLSLIQKDAGKESVSPSPTNGRKSWWQALGNCISESQCASKELRSDCFDRGVDEYDKLDFSMKLKILNFICDEALGTEKLRSWIDDQNTKVVEREKEAKEKLMAAKDKEKRLKQNLQDEVAKAIIAQSGAPLSIRKYEAVVSRIKRDAAHAHSEMLDAMGIVSKRKKISDAIRTEALSLDVNGRAFWKLKGHARDQEILLQDMGALEAVASYEKWFVYGAEQKQAVEEYISYSRAKRLRIQNSARTTPNEGNEADI
ncbi:uncharacterized protein LOC121249017 [Juglans microcarpa x Juglans regia]|uniref:uncharacterized protein LOC121249017 n=1 Tax=Juglans microcarpa x Juglans regia TaxID=2249226 RepID=UPI001B7F0EF0|nr:uncharacterized protein LOC121249017 [Juglans microcarpa x Juglans regia]